MREQEERRVLTRVALRNYKSIGGCDVVPAQLCYLIGPNGSGKSNFLDALRFVTDALQSSLDHALRDRGGIQEVRRRSGGHPTHFGIRLDFRLADGFGGYAFEIGAKPGGEYIVRKEQCHVIFEGKEFRRHEFRIENGQIRACTVQPTPAVLPDRLALVAFSGMPEFRPVFDTFVGMGFYNLNPEQMRDHQAPHPGELMLRDGANIASILARISSANPALKTRIEDYLSRVVPGLDGVSHQGVGHKETLEFRQRVRGAKNPWRFPASSMSDGTLRALGVLVALFQQNGIPRPRLIGIEEPEIALHPAAAGVLNDALREASARAQILVTSHSPDLLDDPDVDSSSLLAVHAVDGETRIGRLDEASRSVMKEGLYTAGELLRLDQLAPDPSAGVMKQLDLFDASESESRSHND